MEQIIGLLSGFITKALTGITKNAKWVETANKHKTTVRLIAGLFSIVSVVGFSLIGEQTLDADQLTSTVDLLLNSLVAFATSQGLYLLEDKTAKKDENVIPETEIIEVYRQKDETQ